MFDMVFVLKKRIVKEMFLFADILNPFFSFSVAINIAAVVFYFKNK